MPSTYSVIPTLGIDLRKRFVPSVDTPADHKLGQYAIGDKNDTWVYVQASEPVATGTCTVSTAFALTDAAGTYTADVAFATGEVGWVRLTTSPLGVTGA